MFTVQNYELHPDFLYDPNEHFWLQVERNRARIGMDPLIQESMGAFVVVQLAKEGTQLGQRDSFGTVEAEKYVGPLRAPVSGSIVVVNSKVAQNPRLPNLDPYGEGWFIEVELSKFDEERGRLITGEEPLRQWFDAEIKKYEDEGWLAEL